MKAKQGVVIGADVLRQRLTGNGAIEHPAHGYTVDVGTLDAKAGDAAPSNV